MIARTTPGSHNPRISVHTMTNRLREIVGRPPYTMHVIYAAFLFWPSLYSLEAFCTHGISSKAHVLIIMMSLIELVEKRSYK